LQIELLGEGAIRIALIWIELQCIGIALIAFFPAWGLWAAYYFEDAFE